MNHKGCEAERRSRGTWSRRWFWRAACSGLAILIAVSAAVGRGQGDQSEGESNEKLTLTVRVYIYAHVSQDDLATAERVASKIFQRAGVELSWVDCPLTRPTAQLNPACTTLDAQTGIRLNIVADLAEGDHVGKSAMGFALATPPPDRGYLASISYARAKRQLLDIQELTLGQLLGHGIAHEIGHLLLGTNSHSPSGLMCAHWNAEELKLAAYAQLKFSGEQAASIRSDVRARLKAEESQTTAVVAAE